MVERPVSPSRKFVSWEEYGGLAERLSNKILKGRGNFDLVVGIARGGFPVALVVADRLRAPIDFVNVKSYLGIGKRGTPKILSTLIEDVKGKKVLIVDDLIDEGDTMETVTEYVNSYHPNSISTAVLFIKPWSGFKPNFYLKSVKEWIVFPWELREFGYEPVRKLREVTFS